MITFDDGYANNILVAEILSSARLPWSVYISSGAVGREKIIYTIELSLLVLQGRARKIEAFNKEWPLTNSREREIAFRAIRQLLKDLPAIDRQKEMQNIRDLFPEKPDGAFAA